MCCEDRWFKEVSLKSIQNAVAEMPENILDAANSVASLKLDKCTFFFFLLLTHNHKP